MNSVVIWFLIGVACMIGELFTASFIVVFFGIGAWAAALVAAVYAGLEQELTAFLLVSLLSLLFLRRRLVTVFQGQKADAPSGCTSDAAPTFAYAGALAEVSRAIPAGGVGEVSLGGSFWRAKSSHFLPEGTRVRVKGPSQEDVLVLEVEPVQ
ncbi:MAG TPA: NfeD family protein [Candidatus Mailhella merdavium]|nr:NfeD family protein [Candidatus Mailhella merdavium]